MHLSVIFNTTEFTCFPRPEAVVRGCSVKKVFLEISQNSQTPPATFLKKRLWHKCFPVNFAEFLRTAFFIEHLRTTASTRRQKERIPKITSALGIKKRALSYVMEKI